MRLQDVINVFGTLSDPIQNTTNSGKKGKEFPFIEMLLIGGIGYLIYLEWKRKNEIDQLKNL
jgi:hypothetical protein